MALGRAAIVGTLLGGPMVLAFFSGGYFERPRLWALGIAWLLVGLAAVVCRQPWPRTAAGWLAVSGLAGLTALTALSITWSPVRDVAQGDAQRLALYLAIVLAGAAALRDRSAARAVEPALALGALLVVVEGLSERLLPGLFSLATSSAAHGRLAQPLTYWNAMALLAGIGGVLCARLAGDPTRRRVVRLAAAAAAPTFAVGVYLPLSRGAALAALVGLALVAVLQPTRTQLRALAVLLVASTPAVVTAALLSSVRALDGSQETREQQGAVMLALLIVAGAVAAVGVARLVPAERDGNPWHAGVRVARLGLGAVVAATVALFVLSAAQHHDVVVNARQGATNQRLTSIESNRGDFWRVARRAFASHPLVGVGSGGFQTEWLHRRTIPYAARDAHSLYFETPAELGVVGLVLLVAWLAGTALCARRAWCRDPTLAAGLIAAAGMWAVHAGLDWDWELPGVTLFALVPVAGLLALGDRKEPAPVVEPLRVGRPPRVEVDDGVAL
jgi:hypothetical protein